MKTVWNDYCVMKLFVEAFLQPSLWAVCPGKGSCLQWRKKYKEIEEYRLKQQFYHELSKDSAISFHKSHDQVRWKIWPQDNHPESFHQQSFQRHRHPMVKSVFAGPPANRIALTRRSTWKESSSNASFFGSPALLQYFKNDLKNDNMTLWQCITIHFNSTARFSCHKSRNTNNPHNPHNPHIHLMNHFLQSQAIWSSHGNSPWMLISASTLGIQLSIHEVWQTWKLKPPGHATMPVLCYTNLPDSKFDTRNTSCWPFASTLPPKTNRCPCKNCYILCFLICCSRSDVVPSPKMLLFFHLVIAPNETPEVITYRFDSWRYQPNAPKPGLHSPHDISTLQARWKAWSLWFSKISRDENPPNSKKAKKNM